MATLWKKITKVMDEEIMGFIPNRSVCQALWRIRAENDKRRREGKAWVWLSMDVKKAFDTVAREVGLAAAEGLGIDAGWMERWEGLWRDMEATLRIAGKRGGRVKWERGVVQGGVTSPGHYAIASLYVVRGVKQEAAHTIQVMVADDGMIGMPKEDLQAMMRLVVGTYRNVYMEISEKQTGCQVFGVAGVGHGETATRGEGGEIRIKVQTMEHLGACLPLDQEVKITKKAREKQEAVRQLWEEEEDIPLQVMIEQFRAEVLGSLRHQQQVARVPAKEEQARQREFAGIIRKRLMLMEVPNAYLEAPRPHGLGMGNISLQGAVDYLAGLGQLRYGAEGVRKDVVVEIREQARRHGLCPTTLVPQPGPWSNEKTILGDLMRSLEQTGAILTLGDGEACGSKRPLLARGNFGNRRSPKQWGVLYDDWGGGAVHELWSAGKAKVPVVRGPYRTIQWLARKGIHHLRDLMEEGETLGSGQVKWKDICPKARGGGGAQEADPRPRGEEGEEVRTEEEGSQQSEGGGREGAGGGKGGSRRPGGRNSWSGERRSRRRG